MIVTVRLAIVLGIMCFRFEKILILFGKLVEKHVTTMEEHNSGYVFYTIGRLSGVMDDRGKYIYISLEEMKAVADYIKREGRVGISHLASQSNQFIDLEPKAQLVEDISMVEEVSAA